MRVVVYLSHVPQLFSIVSRWNHCQTHVSDSAVKKLAPKPGKKVSHFLCLGCGVEIGLQKPYLRMNDPDGGDSPEYAHENGRDCLDCLVKACPDSKHPCAGCGADCHDDGDLYDARDDVADYIRCGPCFFKQRAPMLSDFQAQVQKDRHHRHARNSTPKKKSRMD